MIPECPFASGRGVIVFCRKESCVLWVPIMDDCAVKVALLGTVGMEKALVNGFYEVSGTLEQVVSKLGAIQVDLAALKKLVAKQNELIEAG